jgi:hypothetical protein
VDTLRVMGAVLAPVAPRERAPVAGSGGGVVREWVPA